MSFQSLAEKSFQEPVSKVKSALILDDCEFDRKRIMRLNSKLETPLAMEGVPDINAMNNCLNAKAFDLIMIDYSLGQDDGLSALDMIQKHKLNQSAAKIMISGSTETEIAVSALKRGCSDFVSKRNLTAQKFQKSVYEALRKARPELAEKPASIQSALQAALADGELHDLVKQAVASALADTDKNQTTYFTTYDDSRVYNMIAELISDDDDFIFK